MTKAIAAANPGVTLPNQDIIVVHRSDGSGTTYIFTDYLAKNQPGVEKIRSVGYFRQMAKWNWNPAARAMKG